MPVPPYPVGIIGAGYLGARVATVLPGPIVATTRSGEWTRGPLPDGVQVHALDVCDPSLDPGPLTTVRSLVLCIAPGRVQDRRALYVEGTQRLLDRLGPGDLQRLVWVGSTSALPARDAWLDERCTTPPEGERGLVQYEAEQRVAAHARRHSIPWVVLRMGGLYGPGRELSRIYRRRHKEPLPGDGMAPTNLIHRDDAVSAICAALAAPAHRQGVVHVVDDDHTPRRVMYARMAQRDGCAPVTWAREPKPDAVPQGKRVSNRRLKHWLEMRLHAPQHQRGDESSS